MFQIRVRGIIDESVELKLISNPTVPGPFLGGEYPRIHPHHTSDYIRMPSSLGLSGDDIVSGVVISSSRIDQWF